MYEDKISEVVYERYKIWKGLDALKNTQEPEARHVMQRAMGKLTERQRLVVMRRIGESKELHVIGKELGVTRERVRQIYEAALKKLAIDVRGLAAHGLTPAQDMPVEVLGLSIAKASNLRWAGIETVGQLASTDAEQLIEIPTVGSVMAHRLITNAKKYIQINTKEGQ